MMNVVDTSSVDTQAVSFISVIVVVVLCTRFCVVGKDLDNVVPRALSFFSGNEVGPSDSLQRRHSLGFSCIPRHVFLSSSKDVCAGG